MLLLLLLSIFVVGVRVFSGLVIWNEEREMGDVLVLDVVADERVECVLFEGSSHSDKSGFI